ncbi:MAG: tetratricopeptide repeat protein, partial [Cyanobacteria bacterium J06629_19]
GFTAPEQTMGKPTLASDVYSLGMMAIYLLTATPPLKIPTDRSNGRLLWQPLAPKTDVRLAGILTRAIHPSANIRFSSAADMLAVLNQMTAASPARPAKIQQPASPKAISPKAVSPKAVSPKAVSPKAVSPKAVSPQSISQQPTVVTPSPVASAATTVEPKPISPTFPPRYARQNAATQTPNNQTPNNQLANPPANAIYNPNASGGLLQQPFLKWWLGLLVASCGVGAIALFGSSFSLNIFSRSAPTIDASSPEVLQETIDELEATVNDAPDNQKASLELVDAYLQGGDVDAADGLIDDMLDVDAANADALYQQGKLLFFQSDYSGAIAALEDALSKNDRHGKAAIMLGRAYQEIGEYNDAREQFESALRMGEKGEAHLNLSYLNHLQGDTQAALDKVEDANRFFKGDEKLKIHTQRSTLYFDLRDRARAQEEWEAAIALSPRNPEGYVLQSISQFFLGDSEGAIANLDQAIAINPNFTEAYTMQSLVHLNQGDLEPAAAAIDQAVALDEFSVSTLKIIADVLLSIPEPDLDLALSAMDQALTINPSNPYILNQRCSFMLAVQETETAIDDCTSSIEVNPSNVEAYNTRGQAHLSQLDFASAEADFTHIIEINEAVGRAPDAAAYAQRAAARTGQADTEGAKADLDRALEINSQE